MLRAPFTPAHRTRTVLLAPTGPLPRPELAPVAGELVLVVGPAVHAGRLDAELGEDCGDLRAVLGGVVDGLEEEEPDRQRVVLAAPGRRHGRPILSASGQLHQRIAARADPVAQCR